jgi:hypothetical protein
MIYSLPPGNYFQVKLVPGTSQNLYVDIGTVTPCAEIYIKSEVRHLKPLLPRNLKINSSLEPTTISLGAGDPLFEFNRSDKRTTGALNSILGIAVEGTYNSMLFNWWLYDLVATPNPSGHGDAILSDSAVATPSFTILAADIIAAIAGLPGTLRIEIESQDADGVSRYPLVFDFGVTA